MTEFGVLDFKQEVTFCLLGHGYDPPHSTLTSTPTHFRIYSSTKGLHKHRQSCKTGRLTKEESSTKELAFYYICRCSLKNETETDEKIHQPREIRDKRGGLLVLVMIVLFYLCNVKNKYMHR